MYNNIFGRFLQKKALFLPLPTILILLQLVIRVWNFSFFMHYLQKVNALLILFFASFQGENWLSRTLPAVPASSFYGIQGPSQQGSSTLRQGPQPTHMGMMGYPNLYHSQLGGISREHQPLSSQGNLNGSQGQSSQQSHHLWQHGY